MERGEGLGDGGDREGTALRACGGVGRGGGGKMAAAPPTEQLSPAHKPGEAHLAAQQGQGGCGARGATPRVRHRHVRRGCVPRRAPPPPQYHMNSISIIGSRSRLTAGSQERFSWTAQGLGAARASCGEQAGPSSRLTQLATSFRQHMGPYPGTRPQPK